MDVKHHIYYNIPNPWLQVKLLRFIQHFPPPEVPSSLRFVWTDHLQLCLLGLYFCQFLLFRQFFSYCPILYLSPRCASVCVPVSVHVLVTCTVSTEGRRTVSTAECWWSA